MSPTKISIRAALAVLFLAAPVGAEEVAAEPQSPEAAPVVEAVPAESADAMAAPTVEAQVATEVAPVPAETPEAPAADEAAAVTEDAPPAAMATEAATDEAAPIAEAIPVDDAPVAEGTEVQITEEAELETHPPLGAIGYDSEGRQGRIHIVVRGDTLWDISNAYLATPWVWPSIWQDNDDIENPHRIYPGDRIWITPSEMRKISAEEAAMMLSNLPPEEKGVPAAQEELAFEPEPEPEAPAILSEPVEYGSIRIANRESAGLITPEQLEASGSIVGREYDRLMASQEDDVHVGLGEGEVEVGDQLTVFRTYEKVYDPDTRVLLGYHVEFLGWVEVKETSPETSLVRIGMSNDGLEEGDRVMPRTSMPAELALQAPPDVEGKISFFPQRRVVIGYNDYVFLNRGSIDGLEVGSPLDVYRPGYAADDEARGAKVMVPDSVIGRLVVVKTEDESAVAWVMNSRTELALGDRFRGAGR